MKKRLFALLVTLSCVFAFAASGCTETACGQDDRDACATIHSTCVSACNPLDASYAQCIDTCDTDLCACLDDYGCDC